ncbi:hypothetical protein TPY_3134 [Sulfobacillus acidophilus TPY]|uniref:Uncharacterized protein n=1 Tax=Sulfobacillus acidophilus (strain ATCC 700253 / DSM 10332 / NAL) TaxID=679936 RepID=G8TZZ7_SULAD|nr:hypothetical protein TPY_3134 [Sulfobacillus acidophilus TPY]AEW04166.1 hypothetical protein Sulac_0653 [Sulfobacillus acidophilus DSM 10332]
MDFETVALERGLDELVALTAHAVRAPLGLGDPVAQTDGWYWSMVGDPGHRWTVSVATRHQWRHDGLVAVWQRTAGHLVAQWVWEVAWQSGQWTDQWWMRPVEGRWTRTPVPPDPVWGLTPSAIKPA